MKRKGMNWKFAVVYMLVFAMLCGLGTVAFAEKETADDKTSEKQSEETVKTEKTEKDEKEEKKTADAKDEVDFAELIADIPTIQAFTDEKVDEDDIDAILMAGYNSPNSMNQQPWHFSAVTKDSVLEELASAMSFGKPDGANPPEGFEMPDNLKTPEGMEKPDDMPEFDKDDKDMDKPPMPEGKPNFGKSEDFGKFELSDKKTEVESDDKKSEDKPAEMPSAPVSAGAKAGIGDAPLVIIVSCKEGSELDAGIAVQNMSVEAQLLGYGTKIISSPTIALNGDKQEEYKELLGIPEDMSAVCVLLVGKADTEEYDAVSSATVRNPADELVTIIK